ncbi:branched-chain amino acid ABC transporter substrate-binding protein [Vitreoscilla stercoraria]|uniref:Branched-chain amino acid ABC transporter substrate-binding protein n=1 Tax=Vitreoscilla stercoraria TaxID=61 RepID=A0ABY4EB52_VITST|nr:branched-chain amino acid ABC transporter substrate-binding protein [Vitreoscilla stercoraria]UOO92977.1 branched-chain amino acid ABC transporter substrate-binding protein [Vitreoscilla stercoraria]
MNKLNMKTTSMSLMVALALAACGGQNSGSDAAKTTSSAPAANGNNEIVIGFAAPLTGPQSHYGEEYKNGVQLAIDEANEQKLTINGAPATFKLMAEDDAADPKQATQVAERFVDAKVAGVIGHFNSGTAIPASEVYEDNQIPNIAMATSPTLSGRGLQYVFRSMTSDSQQGTVLGKYAVEKLGYKNIAIIDDRTAYGQGLADEFEKSAKAAGANILPRQFTNDKATDFQSILTGYKTQQPDVIFYGGADTQSAPMIKQIRRLGITVPFMSGEMTKTPTFLEIAAADGEGVFTSLAGFPLDKMPKGTEYATKYKAKYGKDVATYSPYGYDATWAMITAMKDANSSKAADYLSKLKAVSLNGVTSGTFSYDDKGDLKDIAITVYKVEQGKWVPVDSISSGN